MSDRLFAVGWLLLCIAGMVIGWQINSEYNYEPLGPRPFPLLLLALMALCALLMLLRKPDPVSWPPPRVVKRLLLLMAMLLLYGWLFDRLGFPLGTALLTFGIGLLFAARWWAAALSGLLLAALLFLAFDRLLDVSLPTGSWLN